MKRFCIALISCCVLAAQSPPTSVLVGQSPPTYTVTDLGVGSGMSVSTATAISSSGSVVGYSAATGDLLAAGNAAAATGFYFSNGTLTSFGIDAVNMPFGVNAQGTVVGLGFNPTGSAAGDAFVWQDGSFQSPSGLVLSTGFLTLPTAVNDAGQIALTNATSSNDNQGYTVSIWNNGTESAIQSGSSGFALVTALNASGQASGWEASQSSFLPFAWLNGQVKVFTPPTGFSNGTANAISDAGIVVGTAYANLGSGNASGAAATFNNGAATSLGTLPGLSQSFATGINQAGMIVGGAGSNFQYLFKSNNTSAFAGAPLIWPLATLEPLTSDLRAFLYTGGTMYDLNTLIPGDSGWTLSLAVGINDAGQIAGTGFHNGQQRAFLLTPTGPTITHIDGSGLSVPLVTTLSSNGLFSVFGFGFAPSGTAAQPPAVNGNLQTTAGGACVQVGNEMAPLTYVSPTQINAQVPTVPASGTVQVSVITNCGAANQTASAPVTMNVAPVAPEFLYFVHNANGQDPVAAIDNTTFKYIGEPGLIAHATFTPAQTDEIVTIFGVGFGATTPAQTPGTLPKGAAKVAGAIVKLGGQPITPIYIGISGSYAGLYQLSIKIPSGLSGPQALTVTIDGVTSPAGAYLEVGQ